MDILLGLAAAIAMADLLSGFGHWVEDCWFGPDTPLMGRIVRANILHHAEPAAFTGKPWHVTVKSTLPFSGGFALLLWSLGALTWWMGLAIGIATFSNQVHKWAHLPGASVPAAVRALQRWRVLQSPSHHARHHRGEKNTSYCVLTNWLNPVLDAIRFWRGLELLVRLATRAVPRPQ